MKNNKHENSEKQWKPPNKPQLTKNRETKSKIRKLIKKKKIPKKNLKTKRETCETIENLSPAVDTLGHTAGPPSSGDRRAGWKCLHQGV